MRYEFYYWPMIQARGEFPRLALEEAGADYIDVARASEENGGGIPALMAMMNDENAARPPYAPPFLKAGRTVIAQSANILLYLGGRLGLAPKAESGRMWAHQLQLTCADFVDESHNTHHPMGGAHYYEDQIPEAKRFTATFLELRLPKYFGYFERVLSHNSSGSGYLIGAEVSYPDLSLFQLIEGLRYALPQAMARVEQDYPRVVALHDKVQARPRIAAYLASERRIPFNEMGIFRHYDDLDAPG